MENEEAGIISALFAEVRQVEWLTQLKIDRIIGEFGTLLRILVVVQFATFIVLLYEVLK